MMFSVRSTLYIKISLDGATRLRIEESDDFGVLKDVDSMNVGKVMFVDIPLENDVPSLGKENITQSQDINKSNTE